MPTPEHVAALARALVPDAWDDNSDGLKSDLRRAALRAMGGRFFAAIVTDPAAQDAVLAALVEGGRLVEECGLFGVGAPKMEGPRRIMRGGPCSMEQALHYQLVIPGPTTVEVRLVEPEWREATS